RLLLDGDLVPLAPHLDHAGAVAIRHVGDVGHAVDQQRVDALSGQPGVHIPRLVADADAIEAVGLGDLHHPALVIHRGHVLHGRIHPRGPTVRHAEGPASATVTAAAPRRPRSYSARTAAMMAMDLRRDSLAWMPGSTRSRKAVDRRPARKSGCATTRSRMGMVVRTPTTRYSASARAMRSHAAARSAPQTMSLLRSVSYQRGTV